MTRPLKWGGALMLVAMLVAFPSGVSADIIFLKSGEQFEGKIDDENKYRVIVLTERSGRRFFMKKDILRIQRDGEAEPQEEAAPAAAAEGVVSANKADLIRRLLQVNGALDGLQKNFANMIQSAPPEKQADMRQVLQLKGLVDELIPLYAQYYTESDLKELIRFYSSNLGKKHIQATPLLVEKSIPLALNYFKERLEMLEAERR